MEQLHQPQLSGLGGERLQVRDAQLIKASDWPSSLKCVLIVLGASTVALCQPRFTVFNCVTQFERTALGPPPPPQPLHYVNC